jgi:hypothetical protein
MRVTSRLLQLLERTLDFAIRNYSREHVPGGGELLNGRPSEWYTFPENLYRAWQLTGDAKIKAFADTYRYESFWRNFASTSAPADAFGVHAYSHVNTFSSAAMTYAVTGDPVYLNIVRNGYDYLQNTQCYATGGYGPMERLVAPNGTLGRSLEARNATFEAVCGSWAGFKLSRYLMEFTGEARYAPALQRRGRCATHHHRRQAFLLRRLPRGRRHEGIQGVTVFLLHRFLHAEPGGLSQSHLLQRCKRTVCEFVSAFRGNVDGTRW